MPKLSFQFPCPKLNLATSDCLCPRCRNRAYPVKCRFKGKEVAGEEHDSTVSIREKRQTGHVVTEMVTLRPSSQREGNSRVSLKGHSPLHMEELAKRGWSIEAPTPYFQKHELWRESKTHLPSPVLSSAKANPAPSTAFLGRCGLQSIFSRV